MNTQLRDGMVSFISTAAELCCDRGSFVQGLIVITSPPPPHYWIYFLLLKERQPKRQPEFPRSDGRTRF